MNRTKARQEILKAATRNSHVKRRYYMRHINEAVCAVRARRLVSNKVLVAAGFHPVKERGS